jgi:predicted ArsR family transcriptional regulator
MGLRLRLLYLWTPNYVIRRELRNLNDQTTGALTSLLAVYAPEKAFITDKPQTVKGIRDQRANMAQTHAKLVEALEAAVGHDKAVVLGRESLFKVGLALGKQTRSKLGVGNSQSELIRASKILYRILGISFHINRINGAKVVAIIEHCALSEHYSKLTCEVLSATDEGVISGLQPNVNMKVTQYITGGCQNCRATLNFKQKENPK